MLFELTRYLKQPQLTTALCVVHLNRVEALKHMIDQSKINDLLRAIGTTLKRHSRSSSIVGKLRGNDYAIICPGVDKDAAQAIVDRLYTAICKHHAFTTPDGTQWEQTASISCVMLADHPIPASQLLQLAISKASSPQPHRMPETDPTSEDRQAG
jgi:GGDEF domain-containing protein